jgi:hypothetical protein
MKHVTVILTAEACEVLVAHFRANAFECSSPSVLLNHGQQYDYYRDHAVKQGWSHITDFYPRRHHETRDQPVRLVG